MDSAHQSRTSCWTCRVRKKKCDKQRPICAACATLQITCHNGEDRPHWMDNGVNQADMTQKIKAQVKQAMDSRRGNPHVQVSALQTTDACGATGTRPSPPILLEPEQQSSKALPEKVAVSGSASTTSSSFSWSGPFLSQQLKKDPSLESAFDSLTLEDMEVDFTAMYLDYVFPFLFPCYRPSIFEGGRSWLLATLKNSRSLFHTAMSLATYFFTLYLQTAKPSREGGTTCSRYVWEILAGHMDESIRAIQDDIAGLNAVPEGAHARAQMGGPATDLLQRARTMESIIQLQIFESAMARTVGDWDVHLVAAVALFEEVFRRYGVAASGLPSMGAIITAMDRPVALKHSDLTRRIWNPDQGAFRFFVCVLLYMDVIASTALQSPPRLRRYHAQVLVAADNDDGMGSGREHECRFQMENFVGCQSWVLLLVGEIASLDAWKQSQLDGLVKSGELAARGREISGRLRIGLECLRVVSAPKDAPSPIFKAYYLQDNSGLTREQTLITHVWAHAAQIYLSIVTLGWRHDSHDVRDGVANILQLLKEVSTPAVLRCMSWPLCVAGCLASETQEQDFRSVFLAVGALQAFGSLKTAFHTMKRVWQLRGQLDADTWGLSQCATVLGSRVLLI